MDRTSWPWREATRVALTVLVANAVLVGAWALLAPTSFYRDFPGGGRHWVAVDGAFNEHLVRDVGALYLALAAITLWALRRPPNVIGLGLPMVLTIWLAFRPGSDPAGSRASGRQNGESR